MALLKDLFGWEGPYTAQLRQTEERHQDNRARIESLLKSDKARNLMMKMRATYYERGGSTKPYTPTDRFEDLAKLQKFKDNYSMADRETGKLTYTMSKEDKDAYDAARDYVLGREVSGVDSIDPKAKIERKIKASGQPEMTFMGYGDKKEKPKSAADYFAPGGEIGMYEDMGAPKQHNLRLEGQLPVSPDAGMFDRLNEYSQPADFLAPQAPKTYEQIGVSSVDEMSVLDEMQKALPDRDMRKEFEGDPEYMQKLIKLWKEKKLNKSNIREAFSMIQQTARQSLGIA